MPERRYEMKNTDNSKPRFGLLNFIVGLLMVLTWIFGPKNFMLIG